MPRSNNKRKQDCDLLNSEPFADAILLTQGIKEVSTIFANALNIQRPDPATAIDNSLEKKIWFVENTIREVRDMLGNMENNIERLL